MRGGKTVEYGPEEKMPGCFMHGVPEGVAGVGVSVGYVFRVVKSAVQVQVSQELSENRKVILPRAQLERYKKVVVRYNGKPKNKEQLHLEARTEWKATAPKFARSIKPTLEEYFDNSDAWKCK